MLLSMISLVMVDYQMQAEMLEVLDLLSELMPKEEVLNRLELVVLGQEILD